MNDRADGRAFVGKTEQWFDSLHGLRNHVRQELVRRQLAQVIGHDPVRVLDAGCGQGTQSIHLARAGHQVVGLDQSRELLAEFRQQLDTEPKSVRARIRLVEGRIQDAPSLVDQSFEVLLCHGVLMYVDDAADVLDPLTSAAEPGARLSLLVRNGSAPAMRDGLRGNWSAARAAFDSADYTNALGLRAHAHTPRRLDELLHPRWHRETWFGVRTFTDHLVDVGLPDDAEDLLAAEEEAGHRDPYRQVSALLHLVYRRSAATCR